MRREIRMTHHYLRGIISPRSFFAWLIARSKAVWPSAASGYAARNAGSFPSNLCIPQMVMVEVVRAVRVPVK